jgi:hypothetical protein
VPNAVGGAAEEQSVAVIQLAAEAMPTPTRSSMRTLRAIVVDGKNTYLVKTDSETMKLLKSASYRGANERRCKSRVKPG